MKKIVRMECLLKGKVPTLVPIPNTQHREFLILHVPVYRDSAAALLTSQRGLWSERRILNKVQKRRKRQSSYHQRSLGQSYSTYFSTAPHTFDRKAIESKECMEVGEEDE